MCIKITIDSINKKTEGTRLRFINFLPSEKDTRGISRRMCIFKCDCGKDVIVSLGLVMAGKKQSCGCLFKEKLLKRITKYNPIIPSLHKQYKHMISRCYCKTNKSYKYYGGRGVSVCDEWRNSYQSFLDFALSNGWQKGLHIDKDKKGDGLLYSPATVSFLTAAENNKYRRKRIKNEKNRINTVQL